MCLSVLLYIQQKLVADSEFETWIVKGRQGTNLQDKKAEIFMHSWVIKYAGYVMPTVKKQINAKLKDNSAFFFLRKVGKNS